MSDKMVEESKTTEHKSGWLEWIKSAEPENVGMLLCGVFTFLLVLAVIIGGLWLEMHKANISLEKERLKTEQMWLEKEERERKSK